MKRFAAILAVSSLFVAKSCSTAHAETFSKLSFEHIVALRQAKSGEALTEYISLAQLLIEWVEENKPDIAKEAADRYLKLPGILEKLKDKARQTGAEGIEITAATGLDELDAEIGHWITDKAASMEAELRSAAANLEIAHRALVPIVTIVGERERKQKVIGDVILLIAEVLNQQGERDKERRDPEIERSKGNKLKPSATSVPKSDLLPRHAVKE
jgi:hypothetical protein